MSWCHGDPTTAEDDEGSEDDTPALPLLSARVMRILFLPSHAICASSHFRRGEGECQSPHLPCSAAVRAGAHFVSLLVARSSKSLLQQGLILCIPSAWVVGWHLREYCCTSSLHSLLLEKSPRLRVATLAQVFEYFAVVLPRSELMTAVLAVMHADVPERRALLSSLSAALSTESML